MESLSRTEEHILLAVHELGNDAYGITIREHLQEHLGKRFSVGAVYVPLDRLTSRGLLKATETEPRAERGGRRKRVYRMTAKGVAALKDTKTLQDKMWKKIPDLAALKAK